ncbi:MAG: aminoacyl-tRNA hydrolase [Planctomycetes bacterium]|nr:aminoacyl-tRNA hydrolase [Planctomycetota bacterium]
MVGIGNPGKRYAGTRHNAGYMIIENLAEQLGAGPGRERFDSLVQEAPADGEKLLLVRPLTYVNLSGAAVRRALDWYRCPPGDLVVVCDDLNLPLACIRVRRSGSSGGHNGLQSIIDHLGTTEFARIRIGIGSPGPYIDGADYVLGKFADDEQPLIAQACNDAARIVLTWAKRGIDECMNIHNRPQPPPAGSAPEQHEAGQQ